MKKSALLVVAIILATTTFAQSGLKKRPTLAVHYALTDYKSGADVRSNSLTTVINNKQLFKAKRMDPGLAISYMEGFTDNIDFAGTLTGSFVNHPTTTSISNPSGNDALLLELAGTANFKLLKDNYTVSPFITLGVGASLWKGYYGAFVPIGLGLQGKLAEGTFIMLNSQYRIAATENSAYRFYHSLGIASAITSRKEVSIVETPALPQQ